MSHNVSGTFCVLPSPVEYEAAQFKWNHLPHFNDINCPIYEVFILNDSPIKSTMWAAYCVNKIIPIFQKRFAVHFVIATNKTFKYVRSTHSKWALLFVMDWLTFVYPVVCF